METYILKIKEIANNFSYHKFIGLLKEIDKEIIDGHIYHLNQEFIYYFNQITRMVNDQYIADDRPGTLGHMLVENALLNKNKMTPTLALFFILEQKEKIGLDDVCNEINFSSGGSYRMMITEHRDTNKSDFTINLTHYPIETKKNADEYNYSIMSDILHELTHVYQLTRKEKSINPFDKLAYYDYQIDDVLTRNGGNYENLFFHQALLTEFMADEQAYVFMLHLALNHPEYFNNGLIKEKINLYKCRKNGTYGDYGANPRKAFSELITDIKKTYEKYADEHSTALIKPIFEQIETLRQKSKPIIEQLQMQGISEKGVDSYYNIYLKSLYQFDGENIVFADKSNKNVKGI